MAGRRAPGSGEGAGKVGMWIVECGVWSVECGVWSVEFGVWSVECGVLCFAVSAVYYFQLVEKKKKTLLYNPLAVHSQRWESEAITI